MDLGASTRKITIKDSHPILQNTPLLERIIQKHNRPYTHACSLSPNCSSFSTTESTHRTLEVHIYQEKLRVRVYADNERRAVDEYLIRAGALVW